MPQLIFYTLGFAILLIFAGWVVYCLVRKHRSKYPDYESEKLFLVVFGDVLYRGNQSRRTRVIDKHSTGYVWVTNDAVFAWTKTNLNRLFKLTRRCIFDLDSLLIIEINPAYYDGKAPSRVWRWLDWISRFELVKELEQKQEKYLLLYEPESGGSVSSDVRGAITSGVDEGMQLDYTSVVIAKGKLTPNDWRDRILEQASGDPTLLIAAIKNNYVGRLRPSEIEWLNQFLQE